MAVDNIRDTFTFLDITDTSIYKFFEVGPKEFFPDIAGAAASDSNNAEFIIYLFNRNRIIGETFLSFIQRVTSSTLSTWGFALKALPSSTTYFT